MTEDGDLFRSVSGPAQHAVCVWRRQANRRDEEEARWISWSWKCAAAVDSVEVPGWANPGVLEDRPQHQRDIASTGAASMFNHETKRTAWNKDK